MVMNELSRRKQQYLFKSKIFFQIITYSSVIQSENTADKLLKLIESDLEKN